MTPTIAVAAIIFDDRDRVLLIERGKPPGEGLWTVPGGRLEVGESIVAGVAREVREETGLVVEVGPLVEIAVRSGPDHHFVIHDHVARVLSGTLAAASDARAACYATPAELAALPTTAGLVAVIDRARATHRAWSG